MLITDSFLCRPSSSRKPSAWRESKIWYDGCEVSLISSVRHTSFAWEQAMNFQIAWYGKKGLL